MASEGIKLDRGLFDTLQFAYTGHAEEILRAYGADAVMNGLAFPRHEEGNAVATFANSIRQAAQAHREDPVFWPLIPNWNRVESVLPGCLATLRKAVGEDSNGSPRQAATGSARTRGKFRQPSQGAKAVIAPSPSPPAALPRRQHPENPVTASRR